MEQTTNQYIVDLVAGTKEQISDELDAVAKLEAEIFSAEAWNKEMLWETVARDYAYLYLARKGSEQQMVAGYILFTNVGGDAELLHIAVSSAYRRQGIGSLLMDAMLRELNNQQAELLTLEVRSHNETAKTLYKKNGLQEIFVRKNYYKEPTEDAIIMQVQFDSAR